MERSRDSDKNRKSSPHVKMSRDNDYKTSVLKRQFPAPKSLFNFHRRDFFGF